MSKHCAICDKKSELVWSLSKLRGKYNRTTKKRKYPNLQWVTLKSGKKVRACAKCIKSFGKSKRQKKAAPQAPAAKPQVPETKPEKAEKPAEAKKAVKKEKTEKK